MIVYLADRLSRTRWFIWALDAVGQALHEKWLPFVTFTVTCRHCEQPPGQHLARCPLRPR